MDIEMGRVAEAKAHAAEEEMDRLADQRKLDKLLEFPRQETMKNKERSARILAVDQARMKEAARHAAEKLGRKEGYQEQQDACGGKEIGQGTAGKTEDGAEYW
ncbi:hypothetical protein PSTT_07129 [Puccinia striiformis]|uniref:Uncharacterized protein n=1 Tax=Puccinia striiformis TaxID=27350 RepID=A0A2S4VHK6_9BASI|nr:hypothetical protein PSTT_07129 [Puccinia striiformis]